MKYCLLILILSVFSFSCTIKKRSYRNGYYLDLALSNTDRRTSLHVTETSDKKLRYKPKTEVAVPSNEVVASADKTLIASPFLVAPANLSSDSCADIIYFQNGSEVQAKIIAVNQNDIEYKRCDETNASTIKVKKKKVLMLKFANGSTESFQPVQTLPLVPTVHPKAKAALVESLIALVLFPFALFSFLFLFLLVIALILGICTGLQARKKIRTSPDKYKGLKLANAALIICTTLSAILIVITLLVLFLFFIW